MFRPLGFRGMRSRLTQGRAFTGRSLVGVALVVVVWGLAFHTDGSAAQGRDQRAWLSFDYRGNTTQHTANTLGFIAIGATGPDGGYGEESVQNEWQVGVKMRVTIKRQGKEVDVTGVVGRPIVTSVQASGDITKEPEAGCEDFGSLCPQPGAPTFHPTCSVHVSANPEWFRAPNPGFPTAGVEPKGFLGVSMALPGAAAFQSTAANNCRGNVTDLDTRALEVFVEPTPFGDDPPPVVSRQKLAEYQAALSPKLEVGGAQVHGGLKLRLHGKQTFDVTWDWEVGQAKHQIGPNVKYSIDAESEFTNVKLTP